MHIVQNKCAKYPVVRNPSHPPLIMDLRKLEELDTELLKNYLKQLVTATTSTIHSSSATHEAG